VLASVGNVIDASASPFRPLAVGIIGDHHGAVALDHNIRGLEGVGIFGIASSEFELFHRGEATPSTAQWVAHDRFAPLAKEQIATILGWKLRLEIADASGRRAKPEITKWGQRFLGIAVVEVRIAMVGAVKTVADADHVSAAVIFVVAHENVLLGIQRDVI